MSPTAYEGRTPGWSERAAILVLFYREVDLQSMLERLQLVARHIVLVDNSPDGTLLSLRADSMWVSQSLVRTVRNGNRGGLAGAYNAALSNLAETYTDLRQVVFVDDDSACDVLDCFLRDPETQAILQCRDTAAVAPAYRDRATGMRGAYIRLGRWRFSHLSREISGIHRIAFLINSMSVWRREAIEDIGYFDETLGVDHVDTDYCLRARSVGLNLFVHGGHEFNHSIGERRAYRIFGLTLQSGGHSPLRRRSIACNTAALMCRHASREPAFAMLCLSRLAYEAVGVLLAEDQKAAKLRAIVLGAIDGLLNPTRRRRRRGSV